MSDTELQAQLDEGLAPMPEDLVPLHTEALVIKKQIEELEGRLTEIKDTFDATLKGEGLKAFLLHGKKKAKRMVTKRTFIKQKDLAKDMPHIYKKYSYKKDVVSIRLD